MTFTNWTQIAKNGVAKKEMLSALEIEIWNALHTLHKLFPMVVAYRSVSIGQIRKFSNRYYESHFSENAIR